MNISESFLWIIMFVSVIIVDLCIVISGYTMEKHVPKDRFGHVGYRTKRSRQSEEAWQYANKLAGKVFFRMGLIMTVISVAIMLIVMKAEPFKMIYTGVAVLIAESVIVCFPIIYIEKKLKEKF